MADIDALKAKLRTLFALAEKEIDGNHFDLVIHLEEAVETAERLETARSDRDETDD